MYPDKFQRLKHEYDGSALMTEQQVQWQNTQKVMKHLVLHPVPQRPANASMLELLEHVPVGGHAWLAFGNSGVTEMLFNWCHHVIGLGLGWNLVVAAFDVPLLRALRERRIPAYNYSGALPATHFRHAPHLFHRMGFLKAELIVHVRHAGLEPQASTSPRSLPLTRASLALDRCCARAGMRSSPTRTWRGWATRCRCSTSCCDSARFFLSLLHRVVKGFEFVDA